MGNVQFNIAAGRVVELANRVVSNDPTNSAFIAVAIQATGLEDDDTLIDYNTLADLLAAANNEATNVGYSRLTITSLTVTVDDTNDWADVDMADMTWASVATTGGAWGALLLCYDPDTTAGTDSTVIPLLKWDFARTPNGGQIEAVIPTNGFFRAPSNP